MLKAVYPGSFDPITKGHLDIIERASKLYDELIVLIMENENKKCLFSKQERLAMVQTEVAHLPNVKVDIGSGLTVQYAINNDAKVMIRGIRAVVDYENELQIATTNMMLAEDIETIFLLAKPQHSFLSSSAAKVIAQNKGDLSRFVSDNVAKLLMEKL